MARSPVERRGRRPAVLLCAMLLSVLGGCAFDDGQPWGAVTLELRASAPVSLRTAEGRTVAFDRVELAVDGVALYAGEAGAAAFDPSDPPEGCTLCHGGHCHCGDALIDYETLAARIAGAGADAAPVLVVPAVGDATAIEPTPRPIPLESCPGGCEVPRGALRRVEIGVTRIHLVGRSDEVPFDLDLSLRAPISAGLDVPFDRGESVSATLALDLTLPFELLDGLDPAAPDAAVLEDNLATFAGLTVAIRRP